MAKLDDYWKQLSTSEKFQGLEDDQKERVRSRLFDKYVAASPSYYNLPEERRNTIRDAYNQRTALEKTSEFQKTLKQIKPGLEAAAVGGMEGLKAGAKTVAGVAEAPAEMLPIADIAQKGVEKAAPLAKEAGRGFELAKETQPLKSAIALGNVEIPGAKTVAEGLREKSTAAEKIIEPDTDVMGKHFQDKSATGRALTAFDQARLFASGAVHTSNNFVADMIPTTVKDVATWTIADKVFEIAGSGPLGKPRSFRLGWKPPPGAPPPPPGPSGEFKTMIQKQILEDNGRQVAEGPPKPLEHLARKEEEMRYKTWLEDNQGPQEPTPEGDLYPQAKTNVSQMRDHIQKRLQDLQKEPVRVESLSNAEDALAGYYRNKLSMFPRPGEVIELPAGSPAPEKPAMLPAGPQPSGLLKSPEPAPTRIPPTSISQGPTPSPIADLTKTVKERISGKLRERLPNETTQAIGRQAAVIRKSLEDGGWIPKSSEGMKQFDSVLDKIIDLSMEGENKKIAKKASSGLTAVEKSRLAEKGINTKEVEAEAKRLQTEHEQGRIGVNRIEEGIRNHTAGLKALEGEGEEYARNVPLRLRGSTPIDHAAQSLYEEGYLSSPSSSELYKQLSELEVKGPARSATSFYDDAIRNIEHEKEIGAFFEGKVQPSEPTLPGTPGPTMPPTAMAGPGAQVPGQDLMQFKPAADNTQRDIFDILGEVNDYKGEKGAARLGPGGEGGEIDPVARARYEENIKELVRRARAIGYETAEDIMIYAARNAPKDTLEFYRKSITTKTVSPYDTHVYKEFEAAKNGSPAAKKSIADRSMREYLQEKMESLKVRRRSRSLSKLITQFKDGDEGVMALKSMYFVRDNLRKLSEIEKAALRFHIEGESPKLEKLQVFRPNDAEEILRLAKSPTEEMKKAAGAIRPREDEWYQLSHEFYNKLNYFENYVTRRWKQSKQYLDWEGRVLGDRINFTKNRKIVTQAAGINAGFEPKSFDISDDIRAADSMRINLLSKLHALRKISMTFDKDLRPSMMYESSDYPQSRRAQLTPHSGQAPENWLRYDHPLLKGLAINPDYKPAIEYLTGSRSTWMPVRMLESFNALSKRSIFMYSLFHPWAITEMLFAGSSIRDLTVFNRNKNVIYKTLRGVAKAAAMDLESPLEWKRPVESAKELHRSFMEGHAALVNRPLALDASEHTLRMSAIDDAQRDAVHTTLTNLEGWLKSNRMGIAAKPISVIRGVSDIFDKSLWDYWHPMVKMALYENHLEDNLKTFGDKMPVDQIKYATSNFINKAVGGMAWGTLLVTPQAQQAFQWVMMAPDWTIGRVLMGTAAAKTGPEGRQARKLLARGFVTWFLFGNMMNYINTKKSGIKGKYGDGRFMFENDPGRETDVFYGREKDGRSKYLTPSKAFTEIYSDVYYPLRTMRHKVSPIINATVGTLNLMSGETSAFVKNPLDIAKQIAIPMSFRGGNVFATFPKHHGMSKFEAERLLEKYYSTRNRKYLDQAIKYGLENHLDVESLDQVARSRFTSRRRREIERSLLK